MNSIFACCLRVFSKRRLRIDSTDPQSTKQLKSFSSQTCAQRSGPLGGLLFLSAPRWESEGCLCFREFKFNHTRGVFTQGFKRNHILFPFFMRPSCYKSVRLGVRKRTLSYFGERSSQLKMSALGQWQQICLAKKKQIITCKKATWVNSKN